MFFLFFFAKQKVLKQTFWRTFQGPGIGMYTSILTCNPTCWSKLPHSCMQTKFFQKNAIDKDYGSYLSNRARKTKENNGTPMTTKGSYLRFSVVILSFPVLFLGFPRFPQVSLLLTQPPYRFEVTHTFFPPPTQSRAKALEHAKMLKATWDAETEVGHFAPRVWAVPQKRLIGNPPVKQQNLGKTNKT